MQDSDSVFAFNSSNMTDSTTVSIGELLLDDYDTSVSDKKVFNKSFWQLVDHLSGEQEKYVGITDLTDKNAKSIRDLNGGKDIVVTIDNKQWTVTDLRKLDNGHVIATMWLATSAETSQWNTWSADNPTDAYPANMYSTSYIRANGLNSGGCGYAASQGTTTLTPVAQNETHPYAKFTMDSVTESARNVSLINYIVQPKDVAYQETETVRTYINSWNTAMNESWGTPDLEHYKDNMNYSEKSHYNDWADDYLWLPSLAETGTNGSLSIWDLSDTQRSTI